MTDTNPAAWPALVGTGPERAPAPELVNCVDTHGSGDGDRLAAATPEGVEQPTVTIVKTPHVMPTMTFTMTVFHVSGGHT